MKHMVGIMASGSFTFARKNHPNSSCFYALIITFAIWYRESRLIGLGVVEESVDATGSHLFLPFCYFCSIDIKKSPGRF